MSVARATYTTGYPTAAAPLGVTHAGGGITYASPTTVQAPAVVMAPQVTTTYATAPSVAEPVAAGVTTYTAASGPSGVTTYTYQGGYTAAPAPAGASLFDAFDRNHDGVISRAEFAAMQMPQAAGYPQYAAPMMDPGAGYQQYAAPPMMDPGFQFPVGQPMLDPAAMPAAPPMGPPPKRLTDGVATPASVEQQKRAYAQALATQLEEGKRTIKEQSDQAKAILQQQAEEKKLQYAMQIDQQLLEQEMNLNQQTHQQVMQLTQVAFHQKSLLEAQASKLTMEFQQRKMQEALEEKKYELQLRQCDLQERMQQHLRDRQYGGVAGGAGRPAEPPQQDPYAGAVPIVSSTVMGAQPAYEPSITSMQDLGHPGGGIVSGSPPAAYASATFPQTQPGVSPTTGAEQTAYGSVQYFAQSGGTPQYSSAQYGSAQFGGTPTAGYAAPPTHYAAPPTTCGVPQTAFGVGAAPQTSIHSVGGGVSPCGH